MTTIKNDAARLADLRAGDTTLLHRAHERIAELENEVKLRDEFIGVEKACRARLESGDKTARIVELEAEVKEQAARLVTMRDAFAVSSTAHELVLEAEVEQLQRELLVFDACRKTLGDEVTIARTALQVAQTDNARMKELLEKVCVPEVEKLEAVTRLETEVAWLRAEVARLETRVSSGGGTRDMCLLHGVLWAHLLQGTIEIDEFDQLSALPLDQWPKKLQGRE